MESLVVLWFLLAVLTSGGVLADDQGILSVDGQPILTATFIPTVSAVNISRQCVEDSRFYVQALLNHSEWAQSMFSSSGKMQDGLYSYAYVLKNGNTRYEMGLFDQCLSIRSVEREGEGQDGSFSGQFCTVFLSIEPLLPHEMGNVEEDPTTGKRSLIHPKMREQHRLTNPVNKTSKDAVVGFCLPSSCSDVDLRSAVAQRIGRSVFGPGNNMSVVTMTADSFCYTQEKIDAQSVLDGPAFAMILVLGLLVLVIFMATCHELLWAQADQPIKSTSLRSLRCFSVVSNAKSLLSTNSVSSDDISCLHGIRVLTTVWVIMFHMGDETLRRFSYNTNMVIEDSSQWPLQIISNASVAVDTFLLMSALLVTCSLLRDLDRNKGRFSLPLFYFHRYMRLTPVYAIILGFAATLWFRLGSGPDWSYIQYISEDCRAKWWAHLLYINNYEVQTSSMNCIPETWYLACEMQMFWFSPLIIYPLWKWRRAGKAWAAFNMAVFIGVNVAVHIAWDLPPGVIPSRPSMMNRLLDYLANYYPMAYFRFTPYLLGILFGYVIHHSKQSKNYRLKGWVVIGGWILAAVTSLLVLYGFVPYLDENTAPVISRWYAVTYGALNRLAWAGAVAWLIFACVHGYGGWINRLLSWKVFVPMGRLTYVVYLTHYNVIKTINSFARKPMYYSFLQQLVTYCGILVMSFGIAVLITIAVEMPFLKLEKTLTSSSSKGSQRTPTDER